MINKIILGTLLISVSTITPKAFAASKNECAIWLCLPTGFPSGCSSAKKAMIKRIKKLKSPLPSLSACVTAGGNRGFSYNYSVAAYIPSRRTRTCKFDIGGECFSWGDYVQTKERYVKNTYCREVFRGRYMMEPKGCTQTIRYIDVFNNGRIMGETYYFK